jgi:hypothetical protein
MKDAALGFRAHSGWTALVALSVSKGSPLILARERAHLVEVFTYEFRQPYHTAEKMPRAEARAFISRVQAEAKLLAYHAIRSLQSDLREHGYELSRCGLLLASAKPLPGLEKILASHALIHTADGVLFRKALLHASARCGLPVLSVKERELLDRAEQTLRLKPADLTRRVTELGRPLGSPWSQDEKFASLAAWLALAARSKDTSREREQFPAA